MSRLLDNYFTHYMQHEKCIELRKQLEITVFVKQTEIRRFFVLFIVYGVTVLAGVP